MKWKSCAEWPEEVYTSETGDHVSTDTHNTYEAAEAVCKRLRAEGFGGDGHHFPVRVWVDGIGETEDEKKRVAIIEEVQCCLENMEADAYFLGNDASKYSYAYAILGTIDMPRVAIVYSRAKIIEALVEGGCSYEDAVEHYDFNIVRSLPYYEKDNGPIIVDDIEV